jgi:hypothetical protein
MILPALKLDEAGRVVHRHGTRVIFASFRVYSWTALLNFNRPYLNSIIQMLPVISAYSKTI